MDDIKHAGAGHHAEAARVLEAAAKAHHEAAKHCESGNFEKAERFATTAAEQGDIATRHATEVLALYHRHADEKAAAKAADAAEHAAADAKHAAKRDSES